MRIGILTYANVPNFGANLQALSTVYYLRNNGHEPYLINWCPEGFIKRPSTEMQEKQFQSHYHFVEKYIPLTESCVNDKQIVQVIHQYNIEAIIIGSDAVLKVFPLFARIVFPCRKIIAFDKVFGDTIYPNAFWGSFKSEFFCALPVALMSVSSQNSQYYWLVGKKRKLMGQSLEAMNYISVRDDWTQKMIHYLTRGKMTPCITPDPVFAFNKNVQELIPSKEETLKLFCLPEKYFLISFRTRGIVSEKWIQELQEKAKQQNVICVALPMSGVSMFENILDFKIPYPLSPIHWYALIKYSSGYIGENMHPIIVALHNQVPFYCFDTYGIRVLARLFCREHSSKIYHILKKFGLEKTNRIGANTLFFKRPAIKKVLSSLKAFNKQKVKNLNDKQWIDYNKMMEDILQIFKNYKED